MINDPIADMLTRIRNGISRGQKSITMPSSKLLESMAKILEEEGFINGFKTEADTNKPYKELNLDLKYVNGESAIRELDRVSKPGLRIYKKYKEVGYVKRGIGITILSTSKGLMTGKQAMKERVGGEVLAIVW